MDALCVWLLDEAFEQEKLALLVLCMVGMYVLSARLVWRLGKVHAGGSWGLRKSSWFGRWTTQVLRLFYYVGVPLAVFWRSAQLGDLYRDIGLTTTYVGRWDSGWPLLLAGLGEGEQILHLGVGAAIGGAMLGLLLVLWVWYERAVLKATKAPGITVMRAVPWWVALREALYLQLLWALYRGFAATVTAHRLGAASISLSLIAVSWIFDPQRRYDLLSSRGYLVVQDWLFALFTAFLSWIVRLLWFLVLMHALWIWFSGQILTHLTRARAYPAVSPSSRL